jgi:hypothetical protein
MNNKLKESGKKRSWPTWRCLDIYLEKFRKNTKTFSQYTQLLDWDLNPGPPYTNKNTTHSTVFLLYFFFLVALIKLTIMSQRENVSKAGRICTQTLFLRMRTRAGVMMWAMTARFAGTFIISEPREDCASSIVPLWLNTKPLLNMKLSLC